MAKRHKEEEPEEDYEFVPEDFDEDAFIHKEMVSFRTTGILFVWGIIAAAVSWLLYRFAVDGDPGWYLGLAIAAAFGYGLKLLFPRLNIDIDHWGRREWLGTGVLFFFTWLAFFIILLNPPFSDITGPEVDVFVSPEVQFPDEALSIHVFAQDNDAMRNVDIQVIDAADEPVAASFRQLAHHHDQADLEGLPAGDYRVRVVAEDVNGHVTEVVHPFAVRESAIRADAPSDGLLDSPNDAVFVDVPDAIDVFAVRGEVEGGGTVWFRHQNDPEGYVARQDFAGWEEGTQNVTITIEPMNRFHATRMVPATPIVLEPIQLTVERAADPLDTAPRNTQNPTTPPPMNIPGVAPVLVVVGLLGAAAYVRRR